MKERILWVGPEVALGNLKPVMPLKMIMPGMLGTMDDESTKKHQEEVPGSFLVRVRLDQFPGHIVPAHCGWLHFSPIEVNDHVVYRGQPSEVGPGSPDLLKAGMTGIVKETRLIGRDLYAWVQFKGIPYQRMKVWTENLRKVHNTESAQGELFKKEEIECPIQRRLPTKRTMMR